MALPLPDRSVVAAEIAIVSYFDEDGESRLMVKTTGDAQLSGYLGLLRLAEHQLIKLFYEDDE